MPDLKILLLLFFINFSLLNNLSQEVTEIGNLKRNTQIATKFVDNSHKSLFRRNFRIEKLSDFFSLYFLRQGLIFETRKLLLQN